MKQITRRPGPGATSCLTCKRRHKKCDTTRPACERCITGGFVCLGYHNLNENNTNLGLGKLPGQQNYVLEVPSSHSALSPSLSSPDASVGDSSTPFTRDCSSDSPAKGPSELGLTPFDDNAYCFQDNLAYPPSPAQLLNSLEASTSWRPQISQTHSFPIDSASLVSQASTDRYLNYSGDLSARLGIRQSLPKDLSVIPSQTAHMIAFSISQFERLIDLSYFKPVYHQVLMFRESVSRRLQHFSATRCAIYLGSKIFESALNGTSTQKLGYYSQWIKRFEQQLRSNAERNLGLVDAQNCLSGILELTFLKLRFTDSMSTYQLLRNSAPTFLQIIFSDTTLWPYPYDSTSVSLAHILASDNYELGHFVFLDSFCSLAYALPQVIEYDTTIPPFKIDIHPISWVHGCPPELQFALVEINKRCSSQNRVMPEPDWRLIEHRIVSWQPATQAVLESESKKRVAWLAVQESWRQMLLIYLYMAVCGMTSDEEQVQSSVRQVFQLIDTVKGSGSDGTNVHFLAQYLVAGICARSERRRAQVRGKLDSKIENGLWVLRGSDFAPVLDHLWHGAAANGRAIRWTDYIHSRRTVLPIRTRA